jgi:hypothetical protein
MCKHQPLHHDIIIKIINTNVTTPLESLTLKTCVWPLQSSFYLQWLVSYGRYLKFWQWQNFTYCVQTKSAVTAVDHENLHKDSGIVFLCALVTKLSSKSKSEVMAAA